MRALAFLLLFANICFFGWAHWVDVPVEDHYVQAPSVAPAQRLRLAAERTNADANAKAQGMEANAASTADAGSSNSAAADAAARATEKCVSVGPYQDLTTASQVSASLQGSGFTTRQRVERGDLWVGYWVSVPNFASRAEAEQGLARLKANGITDAYVLPGSAQSNAISIGVFSELARAQRRMEELRKMGFEPQMSDRKREASVYWIDIDKQPGQEVDATLLQSQAGAIVRLEMRACQNAPA
jgi:SPOR domain